MADVLRIRVGWTGGAVVGPGVSTLYWRADSTAVPAAVLAFFNAIKGLVPNGVTWTVPNELDIVTVETGILSGVSSQTGGGTLASTGGTGDYKPGTGLRVLWNTAGITRGRRVHGTTFICPIMGVEIPGGVASASAASVIPAAAAALLATAGNDMVVYSKPKAPPGGIGPDSPGAINPVTSATAPQKMTWLRTRRT
jgi:hypothetical protein